jgi:hypothetical protein
MVRTGRLLFSARFTNSNRRHGLRQEGPAMSHKSYTHQLSAWGIPAIYAGIAMAVALTFPRPRG